MLNLAWPFIQKFDENEREVYSATRGKYSTNMKQTLVVVDPEDVGKICASGFCDFRAINAASFGILILLERKSRRSLLLFRQRKGYGWSLSNGSDRLTESSESRSICLLFVLG